MHRVGRREAQRAAAGPAEGLQQLLNDLIRPVGSPHVRHGQGHTGAPGEVTGQVGAQRDGVPVGVTVQVTGLLLHCGGNVGDQGGRRRVGVLIGVQPHRHVELRCTVGTVSPQVIA